MIRLAPEASADFVGMRCFVQPSKLKGCKSEGRDLFLSGSIGRHAHEVVPKKRENRDSLDLFWPWAVAATVGFPLTCPPCSHGLVGIFKKNELVDHGAL